MRRSILRCMVSLWSDTLGTPRTLACRRSPATSMPTSPIIGAGYTGLWTAYALCTRRSVAACRRLRARARRLRRVGPQRRLVLGVLRRAPRAHRSATTDATRRSRCSVRCSTTLDEIERVIAARSASTATGRAAATSTSRRCRRTSSASTRSSPTTVVSGSAKTTTGCSNPTRRGRASAARRTSARCTRRTARRSIRRSSCTGSRPRSSAPASRSTSGRRRSRSPRVACARVRGTIRAEVVVRATEAFTPTLPGLKRALVPVYSLMIATEPLPDAFWAEAGLHQRETFTDARRLVIYGQRTADGRFAFGGRGAPYHFGSRVQPEVRRGPGVSSTRCSTRCGRCSRRSATRRSRTGGVARSASRATGTRRSASTARPAWAGPAATSATASRPRTSPAARSPISSSDATPTSRTCRGSATSRRSGSPSRCAGSASTAPACS